ncbi:MAG: hypothetical protein KF797_10330 [Flavobacteriales bacterium]|nr:hypothetical protein [Flavobacteriales bacterium]
MGRFLRNIAISLGLLLVLASVLDAVMTRVFRNGHTTKAQWIHNMHGQHYDLAIIGSSRAWWNIDMSTMDTACGLRTVNLANNHYSGREVYLNLAMFLANGNTADRILLQIDHYILTAETDGFTSTIYEFLPYLHDSVVEARLAGRSMEWDAMRYIPLWRYVKCNFMWGPEQFITTVTRHRPTLFDSTGTYFSHSNFHGSDQLYMKATNHRLDEDLANVIAMCRERGIRLECFTTPYLNLRGAPEVIAAPARIVAGTGLTLHDFSDRIPGKENYNDTQHLSIAGGKVFTRMLIDEVICPEQVQ